MPEPAEDADEVLAARAQTGERDAFVALVQRHDPVLRRLAWQVLRDVGAVDEVLAQVYRKAFLGLGGFREGASARAWLSKLTWHAAVGAARRGPRPSGSPPAPGSLEDALAELSAEQRAAVLLVDAEGYDFRDAARVLGVAPGTVASQLARAREHLRRCLDAPGGAP